MKKAIKNPVFWIFIVFFALVLFQHRFMFLYHDDYGYASLSYHYVVQGHEGHSFNLRDTVEFLLGHYRAWGGRILFFFIEIVLLSIGLPFFRLVQSLVILGIFYLIYRIVCHYAKVNKATAAILSCSLYGFIQLSVFNSGIFWATASVIYLFPVFFLFLFYYLKITERNFKLKKILTLFSSFTATFSQEQTAAVCLGLCLGVIIYEYLMEKKVSKWNFAYLAASAVGFAILMLAPGNAVRMSEDNFYQQGILDRINTALPHLLDSIYRPDNCIIVFLLLGVSALSAATLLKRDVTANKKLLKLLLTICLVSNTILFSVCISLNKENYSGCLCALFGTERSILMYCFIVLQTLLLCLPVILYLFINKHGLLGILFAMAIGSQAMMALASYYPMRSFLIFILILFPVALVILLENIGKAEIKRCLAVFLCIFIANYTYITRGYASNCDENEYNEQQLVEAANAKEGDVIHLMKLENDSFAEAMPYQEQYGYIIDYWFYNYYSIPQGVIIQYD